MNTDQLLKKLLDAGYKEEHVDSGLWGYYSPCGKFAVYYSVHVENGKIMSGLSAYYNPTDHTQERSLCAEDTDDYVVTADGVWKFITHYEPKAKEYTKYELKIVVTSAVNSREKLVELIQSRLCYINDTTCVVS